MTRSILLSLLSLVVKAIAYFFSMPFLSIAMVPQLPAIQANGKRRVALCYVRLSYTRTGDDPTSPERQRANIEALLAGSGLIIEWYEDVQGHRSGSSVTNRPQWLALEARLGDDDIAVVIANDLARIHRRGWRIGELIGRLQTNGVRLLLAAPGRQIDLSTPMGQMIVQFIAMADEYYVIDARIRQQDNARRRRERGLTTGNTPFGTFRGKGGFLELTQRGSWYLPNAEFVSGIPETCPVPGAIWHCYSDCALHILTLYTTSKMGYEKIAYQMQKEGWPFEDRTDVPRPITGDDVRRVISNWPEYGGLVGVKRAKDRTIADFALLAMEGFNVEHAVFSIDLLASVATRLIDNKEQYKLPEHGVINDAYPYAFRNLFCCAKCEQNARERSDPRLRSTLGGTNQNNIKRYRHKSGVLCGSKARSVQCDVAEADVMRLLSLLKPRAGSLTRLLKIAAHVGNRVTFQRVDAVEQQKKALTRVQRQIEALHKHYRDGILSETEYSRQLEERKRSKAEIETQVMPAPELPFNLEICVAMLDQLDVLWKMSTPQQQQTLAQSLFESVIYDLDEQYIVEYTLTPWARFFLHTTGPLYPDYPNRTA